MLMPLREAKGLSYETIASVRALKGESELSRALSPMSVTMAESLKSLKEQNDVRQ